MRQFSDVDGGAYVDLLRSSFWLYIKNIYIYIYIYIYTIDKYPHGLGKPLIQRIADTLTLLVCSSLERNPIRRRIDGVLFALTEDGFFDEVLGFWVRADL
jgi:hypothetical protein